MNYPNGRRKPANTSKDPAQKQTEFGNRGMTLEQDINDTNQYYLNADKAVIHKKPTPVQIVKVDYPKRSAAVIKEGYFKQASTTDYNGLYRGRYIDFEAKETKNKTSFPLSNIHEHQYAHMKAVCEHAGICFLIIRFAAIGETFLLPAEEMFPYWENQHKSGRKSIPLREIKQLSRTIPFQYQARVDYLSVVDELYFQNGGNM